MRLHTICHTSRKTNHLCSTTLPYFHTMQNAMLNRSQETQDGENRLGIALRQIFLFRLLFLSLSCSLALLSRSLALFQLCFYLALSVAQMVTLSLFLSLSLCLSICFSHFLSFSHTTTLTHSIRLASLSFCLAHAHSLDPTSCFLSLFLSFFPLFPSVSVFLFLFLSLSRAPPPPEPPRTTRKSEPPPTNRQQNAARFSTYLFPCSFRPYFYIIILD